MAFPTSAVLPPVTAPILYKSPRPSTIPQLVALLRLVPGTLLRYCNQLLHFTFAIRSVPAARTLLTYSLDYLS
eukprot:7099641-Pyramimonas_sp.AAC.1